MTDEEAASELNPDLKRERRFALAVGLVLLTYSLAEIKVEARGVWSGLPFAIGRPELLPIGLVVASLFAAVRFWYYGTVLKPTPGQRRRARKRQAKGFEEPVGYNSQENLNLSFSAAFPTVFGGSASLRFVEGRVEGARTLRVTGYTLPLVVRAMDYFERADYTAPIWVNVIAVAVASYRIYGAW